MKRINLILLLLGLCWSGIGFAQTTHVPSNDRGDDNLRRDSNLDGNNLRATVFNFGFSGRTSDRPDFYPYEWPKNTGRDYVALVAILLGGEVTAQDGQTIKIVDTPTYRQDPNGNSWNMEPVPGFQNPESDEIARSDVPDSWPGTTEGGWRDKQDDLTDPGWIGSWNGFFGKNIINADQEMFYRTSDDKYTRPNYIPDRTDPTRGGMGLVMDVRAFAWSQILISDVVFYIHDILNDGTKRIPKTDFLIWLADIVGGDADDDEPFVDLQTNIAFLTDADRIGDENFGTDPVGLASIKFLETPGNQIDGIDNDGDADLSENSFLLSLINGDPDTLVPIFEEEDFDPRTIGPGDKIVLIDTSDYSRTVMEYPAGGGTVVSMGQTFNLPPGGITLFEDTLSDLYDDDLDGLIDERLTLHLERFDEISGSVRAVRYINYLAFEPGDVIKRGFVVAGRDAEMSYENVAPMIDESRDDFFDNDNDWLSLQDDLGLDGLEGSGDPGEGDGVPTSGSGTGFPGEPNIDKTDVSETDLIGITSVIQDPAGNIDFNSISDATLWRNFMIPGDFYIPRPTGEYDTWVSSGYFPIEPGERQRMAISVAMAGGGNTKQADLEAAIQKQRQARTAFESDYRFAQAPTPPTVKAVPGDGKVTLYWDALAEESEDLFIKRLNGPFRDFEGYRIYRATDAAFLDAKTITDGKGVLTLLKPIAQFDLEDGISGFHPVDINGVLYDLGSDNGLVHSYVDSGLVNGQRYFYAVTAYDFGFEFGNIAPSESVIKIDVSTDGSIRTGESVVVVRPRAPIAGYLPAEVQSFEHRQGSASGEINLEVVDPRVIQEGHDYQLTFEDTLIQGTVVDILTTKNFTLTDLTANAVLLDRSTDFGTGVEVPLTDGFRLSFVNEDRVRLNRIESGWSDDGIFDFQFGQVSFLSIQGQQSPYDYEIVFGDVGVGTAKDTTIGFLPLPGKDVNFTIRNVSDNIPVQFALAEIDGTDGRFTINPNNANQTDTIYLLEENDEGRLVYTWQITLNTQPVGARNPESGDTLSIILRKPFLRQDVFVFSLKKESESRELAKNQLEEIRVVPNPYIAAEVWEPRNTYSSGRGPRELHFINLPKTCTIRIFNVNGVLVDRLDHDATLDNGTEIWDMLTVDNLEIAYGIYVYHIEAPGVGEKTGTFAIIK